MLAPDALLAVALLAAWHLRDTIRHAVAVALSPVSTRGGTSWPHCQSANQTDASHWQSTRRGLSCRLQRISPWRTSTYVCRLCCSPVDLVRWSLAGLLPAMALPHACAGVLAVAPPEFPLQLLQPQGAQ